MLAFRNLLRVAITEDWDLNGSTPTPPASELPTETSGQSIEVVREVEEDQNPAPDAVFGEVVAFPTTRPAPAATRHISIDTAGAAAVRDESRPRPFRGPVSQISFSLVAARRQRSLATCPNPGLARRFNEHLRCHV